MNNTEEITIDLFEFVGDFAENKDTAKIIRENYLLPALNEQKYIILNYSGVTSTTQSFTHALISDLIRKFGSKVFDKIAFKNCNEEVKRILSIVSEYMQKSHEE